MRTNSNRLLACLLIAILSTGSLVLAGCAESSSNTQAAASSAAGESAYPSTMPGVYPDRIALTWARDPATSLSVTWRTDASVTAARAQIARARAAPSFYTQARTVEASTEALPADSVSDQNVSVNYHSATFTDLQPNTLYVYRVGDGTHWSEWFHAGTASGEPEPFSFIYLGDAQNNVRSHWSRVIRGAYSEDPDVDFIIHAGDLINNAHRNLEWGHWFEGGGWIQSMVPNVPVPGNHEYDAFRTWTERDTFTLEAAVRDTAMEGTFYEPETDGYDEEPLAATRKEPASNGSPVGTWSYAVDEDDYVGSLRITRGGSGLSGTISNEDHEEISLFDVEFEDGRLTAAFIMEIEKEGPEHLSIHWRPQFTLPENGPEGMEETVYYLNYQGMRVVALNSNLDDGEELERQTEWLERVLSEADTRWLVVTMHHPMFSSGQGRSNETLRETWTPIFDRHRVDLVMQGHDHTYARGRLHNMTQGVNTRSPVGGTVYVNSVSGAKMYEIKEDRWNRYEGIEMERGAENTQLYQVVRVGRDTMKYRSYTATGELYDAFDLIRRPGKDPNKMVERPPANAPPRTHENTLDYTRP